MQIGKMIAIYIVHGEQTIIQTLAVGEQAILLLINLTKPLAQSHWQKKIDRRCDFKSIKRLSLVITSDSETHLLINKYLKLPLHKYYWLLPVSHQLTG